jgi:hypothetical protein
MAFADCRLSRLSITKRPSFYWAYDLDGVEWYFAPRNIVICLLIIGTLTHSERLDTNKNI